MEKIKVEHVSKVFGKHIPQALELVKQQKSKTDILKETGATVGVYNASFAVNEGEIFVIMGLSGSGKSTLIRLLNRLIEPTNGNILIDGENISKMGKDALKTVRRNKMSMVFQNFGLFPHRTLLQNTEYGLEIRGVSKEERTAKAEQALENAGLLAYKDQYPNQLSGGMQQRVGLARALANDPEILLMDEAFSALDPLIRKEMQDELLDLQQTMKKTIIFITHDLNEALRIGDRIAIMKDGSIIQIGTGEEILTNPANDYVRTFVEDVDRSRVLTAENAMVRPVYVNVDLDGPNVALKRMREEAVSLLMAVDKNRRLKGFITADDALAAAKKHEQTVHSIVQSEISTVPPDMLLQDILGMIHNSPTPIAVVKDERLLGVLIRGVVIEALSAYSEENESHE
ncbi:glycine betaine/L-proline ABC transporter ATP-binding protein [Lysinibacillus sp. NPDC097287]|uniref:quaternary amine ABC transporter ATP-binding protein n=1 Tax=Lysinibacillus sp. NPDC097287 TaxID=3364144 RepID=UPI0038143A78